MSGTFTHYGKGALRVAKNYTKGYSHTQSKVRDATSNDPWPPSGRAMHELAQLTYNQQDFIEIMEMMDKRLNDKGKNWRHVLKSLTLLDYLLHAGSENVILYCKDNLYVIKTLREFQYIDEQGKDVGVNVRYKARDIVSLLQDEERLRRERKSRAAMLDRMSRGRLSPESDVTDDENTRRSSRYPQRQNEDDEDLRRALDESKRAAQRDALSAEKRDLERALALSKEEEEKRAKARAEASLIDLFDDQPQPQSPGQQPFIDASLPLQYATIGIQPQFTAMPMQPQYTSFDPFEAQRMQEMMQAQYMQQQAEWAAMQQAAEMQTMQQAQLQAQQEEYLRQQQLLAAQLAQPIAPQPTAVRIGSNNPFAQSIPLRDTMSAGPQLQQRQSPVSFNLTGTYANRESAASAPPRSYQQPSYTGTGFRPSTSWADRQHAHLANLFANRGEDGVDTFGNVGQLRFMSTEAGRLVAQKTGAPDRNPFHRSPQPSEASHIDI